MSLFVTEFVNCCSANILYGFDKAWSHINGGYETEAEWRERVDVWLTTVKPTHAKIGQFVVTLNEPEMKVLRGTFAKHGFRSVNTSGGNHARPVYLLAKTLIKAPVKRKSLIKRLFAA